MKYSWEKIEDNKSYVWHTEGDVKTQIAITDTAEKAHLIAHCLNQPIYAASEIEQLIYTAIERSKVITEKDKEIVELRDAKCKRINICGSYTYDELVAMVKDFDFRTKTKMEQQMILEAEHDLSAGYPASTPSAPLPGSVEEAAKKWIENNEDREYNRMYGHHFRSFLAGASFLSPSTAKGQWVGVEPDIRRLIELKKPHIMPYNLGEMGEIAQIIDRLEKHFSKPLK